jgi:uncharacterized RmlC-like cupin family protein
MIGICEKEQRGMSTIESEPVASLHDRLSHLAADVADSYPLDQLPAGTTRRWVLARETAESEAWVIVWPPGTGLRMHDHAGSSASLRVVSGRLQERYVGSAGEDVHRWLVPGDRFDLSADHRHEVINTDDVEAISVHAYSPPLPMREYDLDKELRQR